MSKNDEKLNKADEINDFFKMPIYYNANKVELKKNIVEDLELVTTVDPSCNPIYEFCFNNDNDISKKLIEQMSKYYTNDTNFLKDSQILLKQYLLEHGLSRNFINHLIFQRKSLLFQI
jgi:hypothetical protein